MDKILTIKDKNGRPAAAWLCEQLKEEDPNSVNFKKGLENFYATQKIEFKEQLPVFTSYLTQCENMNKRANDLAAKILDDKDSFKNNAPGLM